VFPSPLPAPLHLLVLAFACGGSPHRLLGELPARPGIAYFCCEAARSGRGGIEPLQQLETGYRRKTHGQ